jgi:putative ABC transporter-associated repeat protein
MRTALLAVAASLATAAPAHAAVTLRSGHADYGARMVGGKLQSQIKDSTGGKTVWRDPSDVVIAVGSKARSTLPKDNFLGGSGTRLWMIPQTQRSDVIWLGWNTEELRSLRGSLAWTLERVDGPGRVAVFQTGSFGSADVLFDSRRGRPGTRSLALGVHAHGNWAFSRTGTYKLRFRMSVGRRSDTATLTVRVG